MKTVSYLCVLAGLLCVTWAAAGSLSTTTTAVAFGVEIVIVPPAWVNWTAAFVVCAGVVAAIRYSSKPSN